MGKRETQAWMQEFRRIPKQIECVLCDRISFNLTKRVNAKGPRRLEQFAQEVERFCKGDPKRGEDKFVVLLEKEGWYVDADAANASNYQMIKNPSSAPFPPRVLTTHFAN